MRLAPHQLLVCVTCSVVSNSCNPTDCSPPGSSVHEDSPGKNIGVGCHFLLQEIFQTQGSNLGLLHCRQILYYLSHQGQLTFFSFNSSESLMGQKRLGLKTTDSGAKWPGFKSKLFLPLMSSVTLRFLQHCASIISFGKMEIITMYRRGCYEN